MESTEQEPKLDRKKEKPVEFRNENNFYGSQKWVQGIVNRLVLLAIVITIALTGIIALLIFRG